MAAAYTPFRVRFAPHLIKVMAEVNALKTLLCGKQRHSACINICSAISTRTVVKFYGPYGIATG